MVSDTITDEIRGVRRELAVQFGNDLDLILADIRSRETSDGRVYMTLPPRVIPRNRTNQALNGRRRASLTWKTIKPGDSVNAIVRR